MTALRVMIVEDEMLLALDLEDMLLDAGYTVVGQASDMPQALAIAESVDGGSTSPSWTSTWRVGRTASLRPPR